MNNQESLIELTENYLKALLADVSGKSPESFDVQAPFGELGIDSFHVLKIVGALEKDFGALPKTLLFERFRISDLALYFVEEHTSVLENNLFDKTSSNKTEKKESEPVSLNPIKNIIEVEHEKKPVLILESCLSDQPELQKIYYHLFDKHKNEGTVSRGTRNIAPNVFFGKHQKGFFNYGRCKNIIIAYAYAGPDDYFSEIAVEFFNHCRENDLELNILGDSDTNLIGDLSCSSTPFGVVQRVNNLQNFTLKGSSMRRLRYQVTKFQKNGKCITQEYSSGSDEKIDQEIGIIIDEWCSQKTMVNPLVHKVKNEILTGTLDTQHRLFITYLNDRIENVILMTRMKPSTEETDGYLMDLEFYRNDMPLGGLEYAIVNIIEILKDDGCDLFSLGGTYGCRISESNNADQPLDRVLDHLREQNLFNDEGNLQFKNKFRPENKTIYIYREIGRSDPNNIIDIIMMIAEPDKMQTSDNEHHINTLPCQEALGSIDRPVIDIEKVEKENSQKIPVFMEIQNSEKLALHDYNPFCIPDNQIEIDLKTDSWAQLHLLCIKKRLQYLNHLLHQPKKILDSIKQIFPFKHTIITQSGRTAEKVFYQGWPHKGIVLQNILFPTALIHQIENGYTPVEIPTKSTLDLNNEEIWKGNLDLEELKKYKIDSADDVVMICVETSNNAAGGAPVSLNHLKAIKEIISDTKIPIVLDATRIIENAMYCIEYEEECRHLDVWAVIKQFCELSDIVICSIAKDFGINSGGLIAFNDDSLFDVLNPLNQSLGTYLGGVDKKLIHLAMKDKNYVIKQVTQRKNVVEKLKQSWLRKNIPIAINKGAHCILFDIKKMKSLENFNYPVESFIAWFYLRTGIRLGAHSVGMQKETSLNSMVRMAIPVGLPENDVDLIEQRVNDFFQDIHSIPELTPQKQDAFSIGNIKTPYQLLRYHEAQYELQWIEKPLINPIDSYDTSNEVKRQESVPAKNSREMDQSNAVKRSFPSHSDELEAEKTDEIAIIGVAGRYPQAENIRELWSNLIKGKNCITDMPLKRKEQRPSHPFEKPYKGGFLEHVDQFDSLFFNISPREAEFLDPQERLFLEVAYETLEDAGYYPESADNLSEERNIGVFVGAVWSMYQMIGAEEKLRGQDLNPNSFLWSIANRVSYWMNFNGPSLTLDTACSSSLTALHLACESVRQGDCDSAIVGGVNLDLHPHKFGINNAGGALSPDGICRTFGEGANGYVAGEGIGAILITSLSRAKKDKDHIYAVIKSTSINHGGRTSGYTVPSPISQGDLIAKALAKAHVPAQSIGYIEAHGTGTELGDPIEISGLSRAFDQQGAEPKQQCLIGSIKTNIGHLEAAAGIAGVTKVLLQMRHNQIPPSLHSGVLNKHIDFDRSHFKVVQSLTDWQPISNDGKHYPLRAAVSSFGAGGANAHVILEKYTLTNEVNTENEKQTHVFPLSARNEEQLHRFIERLKHFLENDIHTDSRESIASIAWTMQIGKKPFDHRVAFLALDKESLLQELNQYLSELPGDNTLNGHVKNADNITQFLDKKEKQAFIQLISESKQPKKLAQLWVNGVIDDWQVLDLEPHKQKIPLPSYPFATKSHWLPITQSHVFQSEKNDLNPIKENDQSDTEPEFPCLFYQDQWHNRELDKSDQIKTQLKPQDQEIILLVGFKENWIDEFIAYCNTFRNDIRKIIEVKQAKQFSQTSVSTLKEQFFLTLNDESHWDTLISNLTMQSLIPTKICFNASMQINKSFESITQNFNTGSTDIIQTAIHDCVLPMFGICKALQTLRFKQNVHLLYGFETKHSQVSPLHEAMNAFAKSILLETPKLLIKTVNFKDSSVDSRDTISKVYEELFVDKIYSTTVKREKQQRFIKRLTNLEHEPLPASSTCLESPSLLRHQGVYLITGGLGGLGLIFAEHLAKQTHACLVLTGRSVISENKRKAMEHLETLGASKVIYRQTDVSDFKQVESLFNETKQSFGKLHGIIHSAGVLNDSLLKNKDFNDFNSVLKPKVHGVHCLDSVTQHEPLDFFVMFSSLAALGGNAGQTDYSYANHYMDSFAESREQLRHQGKRFGRTWSINWSLWADGGMQIDKHTKAFFRNSLGIIPLQKNIALNAFDYGLNQNFPHLAILQGVQEKIEKAWKINDKPEGDVSLNAVQQDKTTDKPNRRNQVSNNQLYTTVESELCKKVMDFLKLDEADVDLDAILLDLGFDSMGLMAFANDLNDQYKTEITPVLFFDYPNIKSISQYLINEHNEEIKAYHSLNSGDSDSFQPHEDLSNPNSIHALDQDEVINSENQQSDSEEAKSPIATKTEEENVFSSHSRFIDCPIAIVGISGVMPGSDDLDEFWENILNEKNLVTEIPENRWSWQEYDGDPIKEKNKSYSRWGGFMNNVDCFDSMFFGITPREAETMDPQQRLLIQEVWRCVENSGCKMSDLSGSRTGVFVGCSTKDYVDVMRENDIGTDGYSAAGNSDSILANRISYLFNFTGPSISIDTACSSSVVALNRAIESIHVGGCDAAIVGAAQVMLTPIVHISLSTSGMMSPDGKCKTFDAAANGYVRGEGIGSILIKPLDQALKDGNPIHAVIRSCVENHGGQIDNV